MSVAHEAQNSKPSQDRRRRPFQRNPSPLARCIEAAGDVNAGVLLYQLQYRFMRRDALMEHDGRTWAAQTADCWCTEVGLTPKRYKRALRILKDKGLIKVTHAKIRTHDRWPRTFIRLTDGTSDGLHMDPAGTEGDRPRGDHETGGPNGDDLEGDSPLGEDGEERNFPHNAEKPSPTEHERKKNEEDKTIKNVTKKDIEEAWLAAHATVYPELPITRLSGIDWKNARTLVEKFGDEAPAIVDAAVANWDSLIWKIESAKGLFDQGYTPCLHKLAIHADVVLRWWREEVRMSSTEKSTWCEDDLDDEWPIWKPRAQTDSDGQGKKSGA